MDGPEVDVDLIFSHGQPVYGAITDNWPTVEPYFNEVGLSNMEVPVGWCACAYVRTMCGCFLQTHLSWSMTWLQSPCAGQESPCHTNVTRTLMHVVLHLHRLQGCDWLLLAHS